MLCKHHDAQEVRTTMSAQLLSAIEIHDHSWPLANELKHSIGRDHVDGGGRSVFGSLRINNNVVTGAMVCREKSDLDKNYFPMVVDKSWSWSTNFLLTEMG